MSAKTPPASWHTYVKPVLPYLTALVLFFVFKFFTPDPWYTRDSWDYINSAIRGDKFYYRPLGYTQYLKLIHNAGGNYNTAIYLQFIAFLAISFVFLKSLFTLFNFNRTARIVSWALTIFNPFVYYLANFLTSDCLFMSFTGLWMVSLVNSMIRDGKSFYIWAIVHFCCYYFLFSLRFNALYYPLISLLAVFVYKTSLLKKLVIPGVSVILVLAIVKQAENIALREGRTAVFSGLGCWAIANNALHIYNVEDVENDIWYNSEFSFLHQFTLLFKDSVVITENGITDQYMWQKNGPLKSYLYYKTTVKQSHLFFEWFALAPVYKDFATELIKNYPGAFLRAFYLPNLQNCIIPRMEILKFRTTEIPLLDDKARQYIRYNKTGYKYGKHHIITSEAIQRIYSVLNIITIMSSLLALLLYFKNRRSYDATLATLVLFSCFHVITIVLMAFAHPVWIRYIAFNEVFMTLISVSIVYKIAKVYFSINSSPAPVSNDRPKKTEASARQQKRITPAT